MKDAWRDKRVRQLKTKWRRRTNILECTESRTQLFVEVITNKRGRKREGEGRGENAEERKRVGKEKKERWSGRKNRKKEGRRLTKRHGLEVSVGRAGQVKGHHGNKLFFKRGESEAYFLCLSASLHT